MVAAHSDGVKAGARFGTALGQVFGAPGPYTG